jgi:hypothetical protein
LGKVVFLLHLAALTMMVAPLISYPLALLVRQAVKAMEVPVVRQ